ncbi:MAG: ABC transporter permease [Bacteroidia bacterium]|nr:ABC transporter permease [Bacteroidia bacterium]
MNLSYFISKRISQGSSDNNRDRFSSIIHKIAVASITVGLSAAIVSFLIMKGFQETVQNKIYGFSSHLIVSKFTMNNSMEEQPFSYNVDIYNHPEELGVIDHIQEFSHKAGLIKTEDEVLGVVFKGVGKNFDLTRFQENMIEGEFIQFPDSGYAREVVLSEIIAAKLKTKVGDDIIIHFFQNPPRFRKLKVTGIYETNLSDYFDNKIIIGDIRMVQRLNASADSIAGGLEIFVKDVNDIDEALTIIGDSMDYDLYLEKVSDKYIQVFEWLNLLSRQVNILLGIILTVVCVNMISVILILVMERTQMIGLLKAMGAQDRLIQSIFVYNGVNLIAKGLVYGNVIGLGLCYLQDTFKFIELNPHNYYMNYVPIDWNWEIVILLNVAVFVVVTLVLLLPTAIVTRISPIKAIRFD